MAGAPFTPIGPDDLGLNDLGLNDLDRNDLGPNDLGRRGRDATSGHDGSVRPVAPNRELARRTIHNGAVTVAGNLWAAVIGVLTLPLTLRGLGTEQFGLWVLIVSMSATNGWLSLADLGARTATVRAIAAPLAVGDRREAGHQLGAASSMIVGIALLVGLVVATLGRVALPQLFNAPAALTPAVRAALVWFALQAGVELASTVLHAAIEATQRVDRSRALHALRVTCVGVAVAFVATTTGSIVAVARAAAIASVVVSIVTLVVAWRTLPFRLRRGGRRRIVDLVTYGMSVGAINITGVLHRTMDRLVIGVTYGPRQVVFVEIATQITNGAQTLLGVAHSLTSAAPHLHARTDGDGLRALFVRGTRLTILASIPSLAIAAILAGPIIEVWMGATFRDAAGLTAVAVLGTALAVPAQAASLILQATGHARAVLRPAAVAVIANLGMSVLFARWFGVVGVFVATALTAAGLLWSLVRPALAVTGVDASDFLRRGVAPTAVPAIGAVLGAGLGIPFSEPVLALGIGALGAGLLWAVATWRWGLTATDRATLHRARSRANADVTPSM